MVPEQNEYSNFGRSTKLLLHPKDVPDLQFTANTEDKGEISPDTEISVVECKLNKNKGSTDVMEKGGEIPLKFKNTVKIPVINLSNKHIVDYTGDLKKHGEIPPGETDRLHEGHTWFQNPVNCISQWSKALKMGVVSSMELDSSHTATMYSGENDKHGFSFFYS